MFAIQTKPRFRAPSQLQTYSSSRSLYINFLIHFSAVFQVCERGNKNNYAKTAKLIQNNFSASINSFSFGRFHSNDLFWKRQAGTQKKFDLNGAAGVKS
jgi:hypothetical protein